MWDSGASNKKEKQKRGIRCRLNVERGKLCLGDKKKYSKWQGPFVWAKVTTQVTEFLGFITYSRHCFWQEFQKRKLKAGVTFFIHTKFKIQHSQQTKPDKFFYIK